MIMSGNFRLCSDCKLGSLQLYGGARVTLIASLKSTRRTLTPVV